jgi:hypothetical protein
LLRVAAFFGVAFLVVFPAPAFFFDFTAVFAERRVAGFFLAVRFCFFAVVRFARLFPAARLLLVRDVFFFALLLTLPCLRGAILPPAVF